MGKPDPAKNADRPQNHQNPHPNSLDYYLNFTKRSKQAGSLATKAFFQVREFLSRDLPIPQGKDFGEVVSGFIPKFRDDKSAAAAKKAKKQGDIKKTVKKSNEVLAEASTVFPLTLFPDTVRLDRTKLTITIRSFFWTSRVVSIHIEEILNISANVGPFFGSLNIAIRGLTSEDHFNINFFWRKDAIHLKHIIQGYTTALREDNIDTKKLSRKELIATLTELGRDSSV